MKKLILSFCIVKGDCSFVNHFFMQQSSKCFTAEWTVTILLVRKSVVVYNGYKA